jgi:hypothetical protein
VCGTANRHNCRVLGSENPHEVTEQKRDSPKVNVWCAVVKNNIISIFFLEEPTMSGDKCLAVMENTAMRHVPVGTVFHLDGAPPRFPCCVRVLMDRGFPDRWIGRGRPIPWPRCSPHLTTWKNCLSCRVCYQQNVGEHLATNLISPYV